MYRFLIIIIYILRLEMKRYYLKKEVIGNYIYCMNVIEQFYKDFYRSKEGIIYMKEEWFVLNKNRSLLKRIIGYVGNKINNL